ncbi:unnamed protein product [Angiostrongylus costaricensis]|uniref:Sugar phosphate exchanger 3 n=1 Tax=Angiostrongylus costaricensis TaxID=334426 RepID=A0A0R3PY51_ANGCS|nr:unnamed protein product [Angiostrongylus costaricensis]
MASLPISDFCYFRPPLFPSEQSASEFLAVLDGGFLLAYSFGLFGGGMLGDRYNPRVVLSVGMWLSAIAICIVGNWFGTSSRGAVMGLWSACASVGNIIGTVISSKLVLMGYQYAFAANSLLLFMFGFIVHFNLKSAPREVGLPDPIESPDELVRVIEEPTQRPQPISFTRACLLPGVLAYSLAYACLKLVNYGFFFWLPFYLHSHFRWAEADADKLSAWYDVGGIVAAILAGAASVRTSFSSSIKSTPSYVINGLLLAIIGFFIGGPANMISSSVSADLGKSRELRGNTEALSTVTGIVDESFILSPGTGSFGAALGQLLIPSVQAIFGWGAVFYGFIAMIVCTAACLVPLLYREILLRRRNTYTSLSSDSEDESEDVIFAEDEGVRRRVVAGDDAE